MYAITQKDTSGDHATCNTKLEGMDLRSLAPCSTLYVRTRQSSYRIFLIDPQTGYALIEGGRFFTEAAEAVVIGSVSIERVLKAGWIGPGFHLVLHAHGQSIVTSPIQSLQIEDKAPASAQWQ
jgi:hypothetical protein